MVWCSNTGVVWCGVVYSSLTAPQPPPVTVSSNSSSSSLQASSDGAEAGTVSLVITGTDYYDRGGPVGHHISRQVRQTTTR